MFLYLDFLCSFVESIFVYNIFTFPQSNLQTIPANDDFSFLNKVHLYYSLCQSQKRKKSSKHVTLVLTPLIGKRPESGHNSCIRLHYR